MKFVTRSSTVGSWFTSQESPARLLSFLKKAKSSPGWKVAAAATFDDSAQFEQAFSSLGWSYIKQKAPKLLDFLVGFQLVDRNDDNTKAVGVFGFKLPKQWLYAPVFFVNGDLKGHNMLFVKEQNLVIPTKESWINKLLEQDGSFGEKTTLDVEPTNFSQPQIHRLAYPPVMMGSSKMASWVRPALPFLAAVKNAIHNPERLFTKSAAYSGTFCLDFWLQDQPVAAQAALKMAEEYPLIDQGIRRFYGNDFFEKLAKHLHQNSALVQKSSLWKYSSPAPPDVAIFRSVDAHQNPMKVAAWLDTRQREELLRHGRFVLDKRAADEISIVVTIESEWRWHSPLRSGIYSLVEAPGQLTRVLALVQPHTLTAKIPISQSIPKLVMVRLDEELKPTGSIWSGSPNNVLVKEDDDDSSDSEYAGRKDLQSWLDDQEDLSDETEPEGILMAIGPDGQSIGPFKVHSESGDGWRISSELNGDFWSHEDHKLDADETVSGEQYWTLSKRRGGTSPARFGKTWIMPKSWKVVRLAKAEKSSDSSSSKKSLNPIDVNNAARMMSKVDFFEKDSQLKPANPRILETKLKKQGGLPLEIKRKPYSQGEFLCKLGEREWESKKQPLQDGMVLHLGLRDKTAEFMINSVKEKPGRWIVFTKRANKVSLQPGPGSPPWPDPLYSSFRTFSTELPAILSQEIDVPNQPLMAANTDPNIYNDWARGDMSQDRARALAQSAAESGQKDLFDVGMFMSLLKATNIERIRDRAARDAIKAMDSYGRALLTLYWNPEEWEDLFGKQEMPELEDALRNAFETNGDLAIFLRANNIETGSLMGAADEDDIKPSIEEISRT